MFRPIESHTFDDGSEITVGENGRRFELVYPGPGGLETVTPFHDAEETDTTVVCTTKTAECRTIETVEMEGSFATLGAVGAVLAEIARGEREAGRRTHPF